jgi:hypothetical protein
MIIFLPFSSGSAYSVYNLFTIVIVGHDILVLHMVVQRTFSKNIYSKILPPSPNVFRV